jgi:DNA-binding GntR family transcriptional regulator
MGYSTKTEMIYSYLKSNIVNGVLKPGERLIISEIAKELDVSPMPVREALQRLGQDGFVEVIPHVGANVAKMDQKTLSEIFQVRIYLDGLISMLVAQVITDKELKALEDILAELEKHVDEPDTYETIILNRRFHMVIYDACPNKVLRDIYIGIWEKSLYTRTVFLRLPARQQESLEEHREWYEALKTRDPEIARKIGMEHTQKSFDALMKAFDFENRLAFNIKAQGIELKLVGR